MKIRTGFVSNSSSSSFIVQTRPSEWDQLTKEPELFSKIRISKDKIKLLKSCGFFPTKEHDPFAAEMGRVREKTEDDTFLFFQISCNHDYVLQFLVANDIPFKASVHYGHNLYSYDKGNDHIYIVTNFGLKYLIHPENLYFIINDDKEKQYINTDPIRKISKDKFLKDYSEKDSLLMMRANIPNE